MIKAYSLNQLERYPNYLKYLHTKKAEGETYITSSSIAKKFHLNEEMVKKDLQLVSTSSGKPRVGRKIDDLIHDLENFLGYENVSDAILVGVGDLGSAFLKYEGFESLGLHILAGFDIDPSVVGTTINGKQIFSVNKLSNLVKRLNVKIAILTVPAYAANLVSEQLVKAGIKAIWNFAPTHLDVSNEIVVENVNLASSLAKLSHKLRSTYGKE